MNENLQNAVTALIEKSLVAVDTASTFLAAEIPDVVYQLLLWHGVKSFIYFLMGFAVLVSVAGAWVCLYRYVKDPEVSGLPELVRVDKVAPRGFILFLVSMPACIFAFYTINLTWLQILVAPKVWLIEYAARIVR